MTGDTISRAAALTAIDKYFCKVLELNPDLLKDAIISLPSAQTELENKIRAIGYTGKEGRIYIGGRLFAVRELAQ